ncbi:MAG: hypothetical protein GHHEDOFH_00842 [Pseudorhodoplanes sp.]|nr:hypothetical protein [Pseudorhodoplanes sp.]
MGRRSVDPAAVEEQVKRIGTMNKHDLRLLWREQFKSEPPKAFGPDLLRRSLAYRVQELAYGGLSARLKRELADAVRQISRRPSSRIELPRRIKSGAVLIREWKGKIVRVTVVDDRFLYEGETYSSLSEIAYLITGTKWNGPRFFGLRPSTKAGPTAHESESVRAGIPGRPRGRPRKDLVAKAGADTEAAS